MHEVRGWVATENQAQVEALFASGDDATLDAIVLGWMESIGPITSLGLGCSTWSIIRVDSRLVASPRSIRASPPRASSGLLAQFKIQNSKFKIPARQSPRRSGVTAGCWRAFIV